MNYKIVDMRGSTVQAARIALGSDGKGSLSVQQLKAGTYFLHFADGQRKLSAKLVKQ